MTRNILPFYRAPGGIRRARRVSGRAAGRVPGGRPERSGLPGRIRQSWRFVLPRARQGLGCASCHTADPRLPGRHVVTGKPIKPLAPAATRLGSPTRQGREVVQAQLRRHARSRVHAGGKGRSARLPAVPHFQELDVKLKSALRPTGLAAWPAALLIVAFAPAGHAGPAQDREVLLEECGGCHVAYAPQL